MIVEVSNAPGDVLLRCRFVTSLKFVSHEGSKLFPMAFVLLFGVGGLGKSQVLPHGVMKLSGKRCGGIGVGVVSVP